MSHPLTPILTRSVCVAFAESRGNGSVPSHTKYVSQRSGSGPPQAAAQIGPLPRYLLNGEVKVLPVPTVSRSIAECCVHSFRFKRKSALLLDGRSEQC